MSAILRLRLGLGHPIRRSALSALSAGVLLVVLSVVCCQTLPILLNLTHNNNNNNNEYSAVCAAQTCNLQLIAHDTRCNYNMKTSDEIK
jgi:hypothetical protein